MKDTAMDITMLEKLAREALHQADLAYQFNPSSYTYGARSAIEILVRQLAEEAAKAVEPAAAPADAETPVAAEVLL
jgi:hypothetical protein